MCLEPITLHVVLLNMREKNLHKQQQTSKAIARKGSVTEPNQNICQWTVISYTRLIFQWLFWNIDNVGY